MTTYIAGSDLPSLDIDWQDADGNTIDFSSGFTFEVKVGKIGRTAAFTKTSGVTGAATDPNISITWADGELDGLSKGTWTILVIATRTSDGLQRRMHATLTVEESTR